MNNQNKINSYELNREMDKQIEILKQNNCGCGVGYIPIDGIVNNITDKKKKSKKNKKLKKLNTKKSIIMILSIILFSFLIFKIKNQNYIMEVKSYLYKITVFNKILNYKNYLKINQK